jgi:hypothetical protein
MDVRTLSANANRVESLDGCLYQQLHWSRNSKFQGLPKLRQTHRGPFEGDVRNAGRERSRRDYQQMVGEFEIASMQVNFSAIPLGDAERSMRLFAQEVIPSAQPHI